MRMQTQSDFWHLSVKDLWPILVAVVGGIIGMWRVWDSLHGKLNNVGSRVNTIELDTNINKTEIINLRLEQQRSTDDRGVLRERTAINEKSIERIDEEIQTDRIALMSTLHANDRSAAERNAALQVQLARLEERLDLESMVKVVIRNLADHA